MHQFRDGNLGLYSRTPRGRPVCSNAPRQPCSGSRGLGGADGLGGKVGEAEGVDAVGVATGVGVGACDADGRGGGVGPAGGGVGGVDMMRDCMKR